MKIETITLEHAGDLKEYAFAPALAGKIYVYRGQRCAEWGLCPSAFRTSAFANINLRGSTMPQHQILREWATLAAFVELADGAGLPIPGDSPSLRAILSRWYVHGTAMGDSIALLDEKTYEPGEPRRPADVNQWPHPDVLPALALAQHHGIPTRLLDWSRSILVAAYFAADGEPDSKCTCDRRAIWRLAVSPIWWRQQFVQMAHSEEHRNAIFSLTSVPTAAFRDCCHIEIVEPPSFGNTNLFAQKGLFTLVRPGGKDNPDDNITLERALHNVNAVEQPIRDHDREELARELKTQTIPAEWEDDALEVEIAKITLPHSEARSLRTLLSSLGVRQSTIYPGYESVARMLTPPA